MSLHLFYNSKENRATMSTITTLQKINFPIIKAKLPSKCSLTGRNINVGDTIVYYPKDEHGPAYTELLLKVYKPDSLKGNEWLNSVLKDCFEQWINESQRSEEREYYFGSFEEMDGGSYGDWRGAIQQAIENIIEECEEMGVNWIYLNKHDLAAAFQL